MDIKTVGKLRASVWFDQYRCVEMILKEKKDKIILNGLPKRYLNLDGDKQAQVLSGIGEYAGLIGKDMYPETRTVNHDMRYGFKHDGKISFFDGKKAVGTCSFDSDNTTLEVHGFKIEEEERGKGYGKTAFDAFIKYARKIGKIPQFEVCHLSTAFDFLMAQDLDVWYYPDSFDEYAYLILPQHRKLKEESFDIEVATIGQIKEFGDQVRKTTE